jgi:hypothetical protein
MTKITRKLTNEVIDWIRHSKAVSNSNKSFMLLVEKAYELREEFQTIREWKDALYYNLKNK